MALKCLRFSSTGTPRGDSSTPTARALQQQVYKCISLHGPGLRWKLVTLTPVGETVVQVCTTKRVRVETFPACKTTIRVSECSSAPFPNVQGVSNLDQL